MPRIQVRRGLESIRISEIPLDGEFVYTIDEKKVYIGDGETPGGNQISFNSNDLNILQQQGIRLNSTGSNNLIIPSSNKSLWIYRLDITTINSFGSTKIYLGSNVIYEFLTIKPGGMYGGNFIQKPIQGGVNEILSILLPSLVTVCINISWKEV
jgi:hypothetical protein